jgi:hypothetical protein
VGWATLTMFKIKKVLEKVVKDKIFDTDITFNNYGAFKGCQII